MNLSKGPSRFFSLIVQTFALIPADQRLRVGSHIVFSILIALAEVISLASVLPLFYQLISSSSELNIPIAGNLISSQDWHVLLIFVIVIFLIKNTVAVCVSHFELKFLNDFYLKLSEQLYKKFFSQNWSSYASGNSSEAFRKIKTTAYDFTNLVLGNGYLLITDFFICGFMVIVLVWIDVRTIYAILVLIVPMAVFYIFLRRGIISKIDRSFRTLTPQANIVLSQGIESFSEAKIYKKENYFISRFIDISSVTTSQLALLKVFSSFPARIMEIFGIILFAGAVLYAKSFPDQQQGMVVMAGLLSLVLYRVVPSVNRALQSLSQIQAYAYSVSELTEGLSVSERNPSPSEPLTFTSAITLHSVSFNYVSENIILKSVNVSIRKGDFILLEGTSGSGKSTLLHILAGLITEYTGDVTIDATTLSRATLDSWQAKLAIVQQSPLILQDTILRNITFGVNENEIDQQKIDLTLHQTGLDHFVNALPNRLNALVGEHGVTLSGGQRQRLSLARALYRNAELLLLDEVTNQLDETNKIQILTMLKSLSKTGKTIILSSHDNTAKQFASRTLKLNNGLLMEA